MIRSVLGLDIGGANLKAAHMNGQVSVQPFALWKHPGLLPDALTSLVRKFPPANLWAVTMTGELCDCFATKREGVNAILDAVAIVAGSVPVRVWQTNGQMVEPGRARKQPLLTAAANWHALATFAGRYLPSGPGLLVDVGSTTTDIIPLQDGRPAMQGRTDPERLRTGELVYTGATRTPVCALLGTGGAAEWFATTLDVYLVLGLLEEEPTNCATADGRPATRSAAYARLARMLCGDEETCTPDEIDELARAMFRRQCSIIREAIQRVAWRDFDRETIHRGMVEHETIHRPSVILAGSGEFLARQALTMEPALAVARIVSLTEEWGAASSRAACAYAFCRLAAEADVEGF
jgi:probable H4MPT-linked C1 transfer pathway protein